MKISLPKFAAVLAKYLLSFVSWFKITFTLPSPRGLYYLLLCFSGMSNKFPTHQVLFSRDKKGSCKCVVQRLAFDRPVLVLTSVASLPIQFIYTPKDWFYCFTLFGVQKWLRVEQWNRGDKNVVCLHIPFDKNRFRNNSIIHPARFTFLYLMFQCALFFHENYSVALKQAMMKFCVTSSPQSPSDKSAFHVER